MIWLGGPEEDHQLHHCCWTGRVSEREEEEEDLGIMDTHQIYKHSMQCKHNYNTCKYRKEINLYHNTLHVQTTKLRHVSILELFTCL